MHVSMYYNTMSFSPPLFISFFFSAGDGEIKAWRWVDLKSKVTAGAIKTAE